MLTCDIKKAIEICLELNIPFVAYSFPRAKDMVFYANPSSPEESQAYLDGRNEFIVSLFNNDYPYLIGVQPELSPEQIISHAESISVKHEPEIFPWSTDTEYLQYKSQLIQIVEMLRKNKGKTVLSKVKTGRLVPDWLGELDDVFRQFPDTFRCIYNTRETGCWFCATPELLLDIDNESGRLSTMSLAGTRPRKYYSQQEWDDKNIEEHNIVTDYIVDTLTTHGLRPEVGELETVVYGSAEHLRNLITAECSDVDIFGLLSTLSPTPAVAGFPKEEALEMISRYEVHPRYCYAGYVGVVDKDGLHAYVNLRCGHTDGERVCLYGGGGLTSASNAQDEWLETEIKLKRLSALIYNNDAIL